MLRAVSSMGQITMSLADNGTPLLASDQEAVMSTVMSLYLPDNQWQIELINWQEITQAHFQRSVMLLGSGDIAADPSSQSGQLLPPTEEKDQWFCENVMLPSPQRQSFGALPLILIVMSGSLVIVVSWKHRGSDSVGSVTLEKRSRLEELLGWRRYVEIGRPMVSLRAWTCSKCRSCQS